MAGRLIGDDQPAGQKHSYNVPLPALPQTASANTFSDHADRLLRLSSAPLIDAVIVVSPTTPDFRLDTESLSTPGPRNGSPTNSSIDLDASRTPSQVHSRPSSPLQLNQSTESKDSASSSTTLTSLPTISSSSVSRQLLDNGTPAGLLSDPESTPQRPSSSPTGPSSDGRRALHTTSRPDFTLLRHAVDAPPAPPPGAARPNRLSIDNSRRSLGAPVVLDSEEVIRALSANSNASCSLPPLNRFVFPNGLVPLVSSDPSSSTSALTSQHNGRYALNEMEQRTPRHRTFWFVLTQMDGTRYYCVCLWFYSLANARQVKQLEQLSGYRPGDLSSTSEQQRPLIFLPKAFCMVSRYASGLETLAESLKELHLLWKTRNPRFQDMLYNLLDIVRQPLPGQRLRFPISPVRILQLDDPRFSIAEGQVEAKPNLLSSSNGHQQRIDAANQSSTATGNADTSGSNSDANKSENENEQEQEQEHEEGDNDNGNGRSVQPIGSVRVLFDIFGIEGVLQLFSCLVFENNVLFVSSQYTLLSTACEALNSLLYPFAWHHAYIPILPETMIGILCSPSPFLIGIHSSMLKHYKSEILLQMPSQHEDPFATSISRRPRSDTDDDSSSKSKSARLRAKAKKRIKAKITKSGKSKAKRASKLGEGHGKNNNNNDDDADGDAEADGSVSADRDDETTLSFQSQNHHQAEVTIIANLDRGSITSTNPLRVHVDRLSARLPSSALKLLFAELNHILHPDAHSMDWHFPYHHSTTARPSPQLVDSLIRSSFLLFWSKLFLHVPSRNPMALSLKGHPHSYQTWLHNKHHDYRDSLRTLRRFPSTVIVIDKSSYLQDHPQQQFLLHLFQTQAFSVLLENPDAPITADFHRILDLLKTVRGPISPLTLTSIFLPGAPDVLVDYQIHESSSSSSSASSASTLPAASTSLDDEGSFDVFNLVEHRKQRAKTTAARPRILRLPLTASTTDDAESALSDFPVGALWLYGPASGSGNADNAHVYIEVLKDCLEQVLTVGHITTNPTDLKACLSTDEGRMAFSQLLLTESSESNRTQCRSKESFDLLASLVKEFALEAHRFRDFDSLRVIFEALQGFSWSDPSTGDCSYLKDAALIPEVWHDLQFWELTFFTSVATRRFICPPSCDESSRPVAEQHQHQHNHNHNHQQQLVWAKLTSELQEKIVLREDELIHDVLQAYAFNMVQLGVQPSTISSFLHRMSDLTDLRFEWTRDLMVLVNNIARAQSETSLPTPGHGAATAQPLFHVIDNMPSPQPPLSSVPPKRDLLAPISRRNSDMSVITPRRGTHTRRRSDVSSISAASSSAEPSSSAELSEDRSHETPSNSPTTTTELHRPSLAMAIEGAEGSMEVLALGESPHSQDSHVARQVSLMVGDAVVSSPARVPSSGPLLKSSTTLLRAPSTDRNLLSLPSQTPTFSSTSENAHKEKRDKKSTTSWWGGKSKKTKK